MLLREESTRVVGLDVEMRAHVDELLVRRLAANAVEAVAKLVVARSLPLNAVLRDDGLAKLVGLVGVLAAVGNVHLDERVVLAVHDEALCSTRDEREDVITP